MNKTKKIVLTLLLFAFLNAVFAPAAHADWWGATEMSFVVNRAIEEMTKSIYDTTVANLKIAAIRIIQAKLTALMGQNNSAVDGVAGMIISDWKQFIFSSASKYSTQMTDDFFRGLSSGAAPGMQKNVISPAMAAVNAELQANRPNLQNFIGNGDASMIFQAGKSVNPWVAWNVAAQPQNDLAFTYLVAKSVQQAAYNRQVMASMSEGIAGGGNKSKEITASNGNKLTAPGNKQVMAENGKMLSAPVTSYYQGQNITLTGRAFAYMQSEIDLLPLRMLSAAQTIPQVVTGMANQMISQVIQNGADKIINPGSGGS
ncbi:MAG: hypothetical protein NT170_02935, partial [Candidatus Moranbacteria bacterium]|nr:hypothetical protein [Candidatus Moranbacteria bacterium]